MEKEQFLSILSNYLAGKATAEEENFLYIYYKLFMADEDVLALLEDKEKEKLKLAIKANIDQHIDNQPPFATVKRLSLWPRIAAAASITIFLAVGGYFVLHKQKPAQQIVRNQTHDIAPGRNQATLTLANGQKIILTKGLSGQLATQGNMQIKVNSGNAVTYTPQDSATATEITYNTLSTVRGQELPYPLVLADGTKVWLNAASSITYPVAFNGKERSVKITGEAYFEVVHNATHPFKVEVKGQTIEDLGTAFNINAYDDEPNIKTTLISGSVKINDKTVLHPGQAATQHGQNIEIKNVDTEGAIAWKNGYFLFDHEDLPGIMRKISRWYNVDIEYPQGQHISAGFFGSITRYGNVSQVLGMLQETSNVKFKVEGHKIIVTKK
ncbi:MAG TPA: FecR domain-containing protein [Mucilaginibacter sp.]